MSGQEKFKIGIMPGMAELYFRLWSQQMCDSLVVLTKDIAGELSSDSLEITVSDVVSSKDEVAAACRKLCDDRIDLLVVALAPYCPSGVLAPPLTKLDVPVLLWPMQTMEKLEPEKYDLNVIKFNHGVHAVQDLANVLRKNDRAFGILHGHWRQDGFLDELDRWVRAGRAVRAMVNCNPVQVGGHFKDMLDLQVGEDEFVKKMGLKPAVVSMDEFSQLLDNVDDEQIKQCVEKYRETFDIDGDVDDELLSKTARGEIAVRSILSQEKSSACGLNFLELCNDQRIADGLHVAASTLMSEGLGYAGEGDWVTAMLVYGMQQGFGQGTFTEIFSVGYADNRLVLRHWGEGNIAMARSKPRLIRSQFDDSISAVFAIVDFEFECGEATLINLNSTPQGQGQLISISGCITEDSLSATNGPRAVFKPKAEDVRDLLSGYAYNGGSHHLAMVTGDCGEVSDMLGKLARLTGWNYLKM